MEITGLYAGKPQPFGPRKSPSSIIKDPHKQLHIIKTGALEDEQGNKKLHGGPQMAIHQFAQCSYRQLQEAFPEAADKMIIGSIGENISAANMTDTNVYIGDVYRAGQVILQVASPRAPCSKINQRYGKAKVDAFILQTGITGWYYRVLTEGKVSVGDEIELIKRNDEPVNIKTIMHMSKSHTAHLFTKGSIESALHTKGLAQEWKDKLIRRLNNLK